MKALAIIIQTKKGENAFVVTANNFTQEMAQEYSHTVYNVIIQSFKKSKRVDRTFLFKRELSAVCNIAREMVIQVIVPNNEVNYGVECLKKANELLVRHTKNETTYKKYIEIFSSLEELLYSRDFSPVKLHLSLKPSEIQSAKKSIDNDIFSKFPLLNNEGEKALIQNLPLKYSKRAFTQHRESYIRYQVVKTAEFMVDEMPDKNTQVKKLYRQNLALNAFQKNKGSVVLPPKSLARPNYAPPKVVPQLTAAVESPVHNNVQPQVGQRRPDITFSPEKLQSPLEVNPPQPQAHDSAYDGIATFTFGGASTSQMPNFKEPTSATSGSSVGREKPKIFEPYKERQSPAAVETGSFNTFSHDMFNTVSLPAQMNQDRPSMDNSWSQSQSQPSNRPSQDLSQMDFDLLGSISYSNPPVQNQNKNQNLGFSMPNPSPMSQSSTKNTQQVASSDPWDLLDIVSGPSSNTNTNTTANNPSSYLSQSYNQPKPTTPSNQQQPSWNNFGMSQSSFPMQVPQTPASTATLKVLKVMEKFYVTLKNSKVQNLKVAGQIAVEVEDKNFGSSATLSLYLTPTEFWENEGKVSKRPNRKDLVISNTNGFYKLQLGTSNGNVPLFDYLVSPKSLDPSKIPLFFIYKVETAMGGIQNLLLQYKVNEKLNQTYLDVDIIVNFKENISNYGIKTIPTANKITDRQVSWKAKSLGPDSKGKLGVSFERFNGSVDGLIEDFKLTFKGMALINDQMNAYGTMSQTARADQYMDSNLFSSAQKRSIIEYKVLPNDLF